MYTDRIPALDLKKTSAAETSNETNQVDYVSRNKFSDSPVGTLNKGKGPMTPINEYNNRDGTNSLLPKDLQFKLEYEKANSGFYNSRAQDDSQHNSYTHTDGAPLSLYE